MTLYQCSGHTVGAPKGFAPYIGFAYKHASLGKVSPRSWVLGDSDMMKSWLTMDIRLYSVPQNFATNLLRQLLMTSKIPN